MRNTVAVNRAGRRSGGARGPARAHSAAGRLLSVRAAAGYLGIAETTLRDLIVSGDVRHVRLGHCRRIWLRRDDLDQLVERSTERAS